MAKLQLILLLVCTNLFIVSQGLDASQCDDSVLFSCAFNIQTAVQQCRGGVSFKECILNLLSHSQCLNCVCKFLPNICSDSSQNSDQSNQKLDLNNIANNMASLNEKCSMSDMNDCKNQVQSVIQQCTSSQSKLECIKSKLPDKCFQCLCKLAPSICKETQGNNFFSYLKQLGQHFNIENTIKQQSGPANILTGLLSSSIYQAESQSLENQDQQKQQNNEENQEKNQEETQQEQDNQNEIKQLIQFDNEKIQKILPTQVLQDKTFQQIQKKMADKLMKNPQTLQTLLPLAMKYSSEGKVSNDMMKQIFQTGVLEDLVQDFEEYKSNDDNSKKMSDSKNKDKSDKNQKENVNIDDLINNSQKQNEEVNNIANEIDLDLEKEIKLANEKLHKVNKSNLRKTCNEELKQDCKFSIKQLHLLCIQDKKQDIKKCIKKKLIMKECDKCICKLLPDIC